MCGDAVSELMIPASLQGPIPQVMPPTAPLVPLGKYAGQYSTMCVITCRLKFSIVASLAHVHIHVYMYMYMHVHILQRTFVVCTCICTLYRSSLCSERVVYNVCYYMYTCM